MRTITLEEHWSLPEFLRAVDARSQRDLAANDYMKKVRAKLSDLGQIRIADMDAAQIEMQVLSLAGGDLDRFDAETAASFARDANDAMAEAVRVHPTRFAAFAAISLQDPQAAARELERCIRQLRFVGVMVNGTVDGHFLDHPRFTPFWEAAHALDIPVYLHPAPPPMPVFQSYFNGLPADLGFMLSTAGWGWHVETGLHVLRLIVTGLFDRFPRLQLIIGHMGEDLPYSLARANSVLSRAGHKLSRSVAEIFHQHVHITTSGYFTVPPFLCALQVVGADRILFSIDYPFSSTETGRRFLDSLPVNPADLHKIAHGNAERLLKLPNATD
ncbi:MAG TPA: amidohydrolase family protein [Acidobacteriaceae bacterium]|nr:amidohydrolase family protein [Acidobacteriaceae bacterium]